MTPSAQVRPFLEESTDPSNSEKTAEAWWLVVEWEGSAVVGGVRPFWWPTDRRDHHITATRSETGLRSLHYHCRASFSNGMSILFFVMLFLHELDASYAWLETLVSNVEDFIAESG
jgi:hypothetical protein